MDKIKKNLDIGPNKMIVLALLCGCDYCPGVDGIGKDTAIKFFNSYNEDKILDRVKTWKDKTQYYSELEMKVDNKSLCVNCGHFGRIQEHTKKGCAICRSHTGCDSSLWKYK